MIQRNVYFLSRSSLLFDSSETSRLTATCFPRNQMSFVVWTLSFFCLLFHCELAKTPFLTPFRNGRTIPSTNSFLDVFNMQTMMRFFAFGHPIKDLKSTTTSYSELNPRNILQEEALTPCLIDGSERKKSSFFGMRFWLNN